MKVEFQHKCAICGGDFGRQLWRHVQSEHNLTPEQYYNSYVIEADDYDGKCQICGEPTKFKGITKGYDACCCRSHATQFAWDCDDGTRHEMQSKLGKEIMTDVNTWMWDHPDFQEYFKERNENLSKMMTELNHQFWEDPEYRKRHIEWNKQFMSDKKNKAYMDKMNFKYDYGILYIITRGTEFKLGIARSDPNDKLVRLWSKKIKYCIEDSNILVWYGTGELVSEIEYNLKIKFNAVHGLEFFDIKLLDEFKNYISKFNLEIIM